MERTWTALWKMPPRPMRSLKMRLIWRMVLFVFSESLFVTSYTWSTTSCIAAPPPASRYSSSPVAEAAVRFGLGRRERDGRGDRSVGAWGGCWLAGRLQWWWWFCPTRVVSSDPGLALGTLTSGPSSTSFHFPLVSVAGGVAARRVERVGASRVLRRRPGSRSRRGWVDYDGRAKVLNVTVAPVSVATRPRRPLISCAIDLMPVFRQDMYVGFSAATGSWRDRITSSRGASASAATESRNPSISRRCRKPRSHRLPRKVYRGVLLRPSGDMVAIKRISSTGT
jgi:hypothetical protein